MPDRKKWQQMLEDPDFHDLSPKDQMGYARKYAPNTPSEVIQKVIKGYGKKFSTRPTTGENLFKQTIGKPLAENAEMIGAISGNLLGDITGLSMGRPKLGGAIGGAAGSFAGSLIGSGLQELKPNLFGDPPEDPLNEAKWDAFIDVGMSAFAGGVAKGAAYSYPGFQVLKHGVVNKTERILAAPFVSHMMNLAKKELNSGDLSAILRFPGIPNSFAQMFQTGSNIAGALSQREFRVLGKKSYELTRSEYDDLVRVESNIFGNVFPPNSGLKDEALSDIALGKTVQSQIKSFRRVIKSMEDVIYPGIDAVAELPQNTAKFTIPAPVIESVENIDPITRKIIPNAVQAVGKSEEKIIKGPIYGNKFAKRFEQIKKTLDDLESNQSIIASGNIEAVKNRFAPLRKLINNLESQTKGEILDSSGNRVINPFILSYKDANQLKQALGDLSNFDGVNTTFMEGGFKGLYSDLRDDVVSSMENNWGSEEISKVTRRAWDITRFRFEIGKPALMKAVNNNNSQGIIEWVMKNPGGADEIVKALGGRPPKALGIPAQADANKAIQAKFMKHIMAVSEIPGEAAIDAEKALGLLEGVNPKSEIFRSIFPTAKQRGNVIQFWKAAAHTAEIPPKAGSISLQIRKAGFLLMAAANPVYGGMGLGVIIGAEDFTKRIILDPKLGRAAAEALRTGANTTAARNFQRRAFNALKGSQVVMKSAGKTYLGYINDQGRPIANLDQPREDLRQLNPQL